MKKSEERTIYRFALLGLGMFGAYALLIINQQFPVVLNFASILSPTGAQVSVGGFRIKHWVVGTVMLVIGAIIFSSNMNSRKISITQGASLSMIGSGIFLIADEYEAVIKTITTGEYP